MENENENSTNNISFSFIKTFIRWVIAGMLFFSATIKQQIVIAIELNTGTVARPVVPKYVIEMPVYKALKTCATVQ